MPARMNISPHYIAIETERLSPRDFGALMRLAVYRWQTDELPGTPSAMARVMGVSVVDAEKLKPKLEAFFAPGRLFGVELAAAEARYQRRARAGRIGAAQLWKNKRAEVGPQA